MAAKFTKVEIASLKKASAKISEAFEVARDIAAAASDRAGNERLTWADRSEKWQDSDKGQEANDAIEAMEGWAGTLEQFADDAENAASVLDGLLSEIDS